MGVKDITHPDDMDSSMGHIKKAINMSVDNYQLEKRYLHKEGHHIHAVVTVTVRRDNEGKLLEFITQILNITPRILAENKKAALLDLTEEQNASLMNFAHIVSHNLRSHASNLSMLTQFLKEEQDAEERGHLHTMLHNAAEGLSETVHHLNTVVHVKTQIADQLVPINLRGVVSRVTSSIPAISGEHNVNIDIKIDAKTSVLAVAAYLESIFFNLFTNAIKYRSAERPLDINIKSKESKDEVQVFFKDNGLGIDLNRYGQHLFGMYKTFHKNKEAKGIGLFITKNQIEAMNGKITVASAVNEGATFILTLKKGMEV